MAHEMKAVAFSRHLPIGKPRRAAGSVPPPPPASVPRPPGEDRGGIGQPVDAKLRAPRPRPGGAGPAADPGLRRGRVVEAVGAEVELFQPGDEVYYAGDVTRPGCNAQYHLVDERLAGPKPTTLDFAEAAALPLTTITAWELLFERMPYDFDAEDNARSLLVIAGAGGVGSTAIQLARHAGFTVIARPRGRRPVGLVPADGRPSPWSTTASRWRRNCRRWASTAWTNWPIPTATGTRWANCWRRRDTSA